MKNRSSLAQTIILILIFCFLSFVGAKLTVKVAEVPFTLQSLFVLLSGLLGGPVIGFFSQLLYLCLGWFFPVFSSDTKFGVEAFTAPTAGFLLAFPFVAFICGMWNSFTHRFYRLFLIPLTAHTFLFICGITGLIYIGNLSFDKSLKIGFLDLALFGYLKCLMATMIAYLFNNRIKGELKGL